MKHAFQFSNLLGTLYRKGNICLTDENELITPVGNKLSIYSLKRGKSETLPLESSYNITTFAITSDNSTLIVINEEGETIIYSLISMCIIQKYKFFTHINQCKISPNNKYFAVTKNNLVQIFALPHCTQRQFNPFKLLKTYKKSFEEITCLDWSNTNSFMVCGGIDSVVRFYSLVPYKNFGGSLSLSGHKSPIVGVFFLKDSLNIVSVSTNGKVVLWHCNTKLQDMEIDHEYVKGKMLLSSLTNEFCTNPEEDEYIRDVMQDKNNEDRESNADKIIGKNSDVEPTIKIKLSSNPPPLIRYKIEKKFLYEKPSSNHSTLQEKRDNNVNNYFESPFIDAAGEKPKKTTNDLDFRECNNKNKNDEIKWAVSGPFVITCCDFNTLRGLLVSGTNIGVFYIHEMPEFLPLQTLSLPEHNPLNAITVNPSGEWIALATAITGNLVVWEWQTSNFVLNQRGHFNDVCVLAYGPDNSRLASGCWDGKVKIWDTVSGLCLKTFMDHSSAITQIRFGAKGNAVFTSSLDGTVKAYDLVRMKCFRTFSCPVPEDSSRTHQLSSLALDNSSGNTFASQLSTQFVFAGSSLSFEIYLWSCKTGQLLETLSGHSGPISALEFDAQNCILISASWDQTIKTWDVLGSKTCTETIIVGSEVLTMALHPLGGIIGISTLNGHLSFWDTKSAEPLGTIEGAQTDLQPGRSHTDLIKATTIAKSKAFTALAFSPDGETLLAGGDSKYICFYALPYMDETNQTNNNSNIAWNQVTLLKKWAINQNRSLDRLASDESLDRRRLTEFGNLARSEFEVNTNIMDDIENGGAGTGSNNSAAGIKAMAIKLPGVRAQGGVDGSSRFFAPEMRLTSINFSPDGRSFATACTEGILIYSVDPPPRLSLAHYFDTALGMDSSVTPQNIQHYLRQDVREYGRALIASLKLGDMEMLKLTLITIPENEVNRLIKCLSPPCVLRLSQALTQCVTTSQKDKSNEISRLNTTTAEQSLNNSSPPNVKQIPIEFYMRWIHALLVVRGPDVFSKSAYQKTTLLFDEPKSINNKNQDNIMPISSHLQIGPILMGLRQALSSRYDSLREICNHNKYYGEYAEMLNGFKDNHLSVK